MITKTIAINAGKPYEVLVGHNLLDEAGEYIARVHKPSTAVLLSDSNVAPLYADRLAASLEASGFKVMRATVPAGEPSKSLSIVEQLANEWSLAGLHRSGLIVALGGGVVGDLSGFSASCYQRGIPFVQIPTTLLAAVDSSVGGKTAVNIAAGKNLVGAFYQPKLVLCDVDLIATMEDLYFADGVAESIKYGVLNEPALFARLEASPVSQTSDDLDAIVDVCVQYKNDLVSRDEFDKGARQLLNLGHTFAHAIEILSNFQITHGHAVAIGLAMMARAAVKTGRAEAEMSQRIDRTLTLNHLPIHCDYTAEELCEACRRDKKAGDDHITIVMPHAIGQCELETVSYETLLELLTLGKEPV